MSSTPSRSSNGHPRAPNGGANSSARRGASLTRDALAIGSLGEAPEVEEDDAVHALLKQRWADMEERIAKLFGGLSGGRGVEGQPVGSEEAGVETEHAKTSALPPKKAARQIDDDYGDDEEEEEGEEEAVERETPLKAKDKKVLVNGLSPHAVRSPGLAPKPSATRTNTASSSDQIKSSEDVRKQLDEDKKVAADAAKRSFQSMFYTWESDHDAMLEQQKLDELDREVENEISGGPNGASHPQQSAPGVTSAPSNRGTLGSADLGASSLTLKHLIARIDLKRDMVKASDNQLRTLISEVRKGRSKWASEDRVGQEELYESAEKVLMELKAMTEYAQPFLQRVAKREAPDYFQVIKTPMDIGTMLKKLKQLAYKSKKDFVDDLNLIWANCLKYNSTPDHPFRKKALYMRKETDKLIPLIPEITVKDRAEAEADERQQQALDAEESDDDDDALLASRGRKAPKKGSKGAPSSARKAPSVAVDDTSTPAPDVRPAMHASASILRNEFLRADSEAHDAGSTGFATPPPGTATPLVNGHHGSGAGGSQVDLMEVDALGHSIISLTQEDADDDDTEYKTWKQVTKKDRAVAAAERNRLFHGHRLNADEPALLRSKAGMRRWQRQQKILSPQSADADAETKEGGETAKPSGPGETLAEGIEGDEDSTLPDYYNPLSAIPDLEDRLRWTTDSEGNVVPQSEEWMRMYAKGQYVSTDGGSLTKRMEANMRQMQETRKICSKIGLVKQMQLQGQTYQNQFQKYEPQPFVEQDVGGVVVSENGPLTSPWLNRAALQRSVGKIFYHAGFEDFQPSALDAVTDVASEYFRKLVEGFKCFREQPKTTEAEAPAVFSFEQQTLHALHENGLDLEALEAYVKDDVERLGTKLGVVHDRMRSHLADLLRPALGEQAGADGVGAFHDGSEQFVGGDFAEDLDEDFFGFRELGLAAELGLESMSVPLHLLQNRMQNAFQAQHQGPVINAGFVFTPPEPYEPISNETMPEQIGIVQDFFRARLRANHEEALVEDEDLPQKQRFPKPRLPANGKISSPRKRPIREQQQAAKKRRKMEDGGGIGVDETGDGGGSHSKFGKPVGALKLRMPERSGGDGVDPEKDGEANGAMISPESIAGN
ncbi:Transcriptional activator spt7 [Friedmanniomyces endolithicus]|uniref:Transcriptional activator spt7 n=1 Tax=Rachicladosporium monterosium TaxID=1507873 RepID=A0ABR0LC19_9PEZI|nr:Transcriptional activator spt7 [Friedmanniomyces endolithicus]KAK5146574.1 Transcriptional activator spt7 [Rachicladosporium monterosium]